ncbi:hypothetical protein KFL_006170100 [Klebsormidium nitens]|uniref:BZIP domain-containing protein n=1 Tax=Klebsormidium nitens TaxID=105231 RepID=A0A1Y1IJD3_KLENI|nr:hypothetical protein KFL_006170100 [Klebsormidium nitens]|eukprot:GAQ90242.1 hypothetical protein KFL_006170100 [Klebsormidium nitens]
MDSDADIELPADWQEGVATFLAAFAETEAPSLDQLLPSKPEPDGHPAFLPVPADTFAAAADGHFDAASLTLPAEVACPYLKTSSPTSSASMFGEGVATPSSLELPGDSGGSRTRTASSSLESDKMKGRINKAAALADVKKQKLREKNRRAQQTYRNKQKKVIQSISSSLEELNLRVQQLEQEKLDLETRNKMLRKVWRSTSELLSPPLDAEGKAMEGASDESGFEAVRHFYTLVLPEEAHKITTGYFSDITVDDFVRFWKVYTGKLRGFLEDGADDPESLAYRQLEELILAQRSHSLPFVPDDPRFAALATAAWGQIKEEATEVPTREYWAKVLRALGLSGEQQQAVLAIHCQLVARCEELLQERRDILASLQSSLPTYSKTLLENPGLVYASHEAKRLALNLEHEKRAVLACKRDFRCAILTPLQEARGIVASCPHAMDVRALCELVAEDEAGLEDHG